MSDKSSGLIRIVSAILIAGGAGTYVGQSLMDELEYCAPLIEHEKRHIIMENKVAILECESKIAKTK